MIDLLPCPFCGEPALEGEMSLNRHGRFKCGRTDCPTYGMDYVPRHIWNRRADALAAEQSGTTLEGALEAIEQRLADNTNDRETVHAVYKMVRTLRQSTEKEPK